MPQIWVIFIILSIVLNIVNKNKKQSAAKTADNGKKAPQPAARPAPQAAPRRPAAQTKPVAQATEAKPSPPAHQARPLEAHIHAPTAVMGMEGVGTEGEDCCHEFMLPDRAAIAPGAPADPDAQKTLEAQALLQGVIFSEILGRRPIRVYGRKQA